MESITELRRLARERRDKAISQAKKQYAATLARVAAVEQDLLGHQPSDHRCMSDIIEQAIPKDRQFTTGDVLAALQAMEPDRRWYLRTITNQIARLKSKGYIKRLRRPTRTTPAIYACVDSDAAKAAVEQKTLVEAAVEALEGTAMNATELSLAVLAAGYQTNMGYRRLRAEINTALRRVPDRFNFSGKKWELVG